MGVALNYELSDNIDVFCYAPAAVETVLLDQGCGESGLEKAIRTSPVHTITPKRAAEVCFRDLGHTAQSIGSYRHELQYSLYPIWL